ncbi:hypothetical protein SAMN05444920_115231 [Nonomuraea solani]|uniref:Peptidase inhibitor family I36 n=1 Tax=Nonomuraea solani TaxID=1144553 RepID=A0A1H6ER24_9ACTN|nr:hypothetical protein [Nonomuraea solani]SEH00252.1 hypothetical protein SAMN05444920_115231 [Nonomuraea solani]
MKLSRLFATMLGAACAVTVAAPSASAALEGGYRIKADNGKCLFHQGGMPFHLVADCEQGGQAAVWNIQATGDQAYEDFGTPHHIYYDRYIAAAFGSGDYRFCLENYDNKLTEMIVAERAIGGIRRTTQGDDVFNYAASRSRTPAARVGKS